MRLRLAAALAAAAVPVVAAQPSSDWSTRFGGVGTRGEVYDLAFDAAGRLFVAGNLRTAGGLPTQGGAMWDGQRWHTLFDTDTSPINGIGGTAFAVATAPNGDVYFAGDLSSDNLPANGLLRWDGQRAHRVVGVGGGLGSGLGGQATVQDVAVSGTDVWVAGGSAGFREAGGEPAHGLARWDGARWHGYAFPDGTEVNAVAAGLNGVVYVAGRFENDSPFPARPALLRYENGVQTVVDVPGSVNLPDGQGGSYPVYLAGASAVAVAPDGTACAHVVYPGNPVGATFVACRAPATGDVTLTRTGSFADVTGLAFAPDGTLHAAFGQVPGTAAAPAAHAHSFARLQNGTWEVYGRVGGLANHTRPRALAISAAGTVAGGGDLRTVGGKTVHHVARYDGAAWHGLGGLGTDAPVTSFARTAAGAVVAAGHFSTAGTAETAGVARLDGLGWDGLGVTSSDTQGLGVGAEAVRAEGTAIVAAGRLGQAVGRRGFSGVARWSGTRWDSLGGAFGGTPYALARLGGDLVAAGQFGHAGGTEALNVARWDGTAWRAMGSGLTLLAADGRVRTLAVAGGQLYAGGAFASPDFTYDGVMRWTGTAWVVPGGGLDVGIGSGGGRVAALVTGPDGRLYAGGFFQARADASVRTLAVFDGTAWTNLSDGLPLAYVEALAVGADGTIYAGNETGVYARRVGGAWVRLDVPALRYPGFMATRVNALMSTPEGLYVGGLFATAGGWQATNITLFTGAIPTAAGETPLSPAAALDAPYPNPSRGWTTVAFSLPVPGPASLVAYDALGRRVAVLAAGAFTSGRHQAAFDTGALAPGVYLVRLDAAGHSATRPLVVSR